VDLPFGFPLQDQQDKVGWFVAEVANRISKQLKKPGKLTPLLTPMITEQVTIQSH